MNMSCFGLVQLGAYRCLAFLSGTFQSVLPQSLVRVSNLGNKCSGDGTIVYIICASSYDFRPRALIPFDIHASSEMSVETLPDVGIDVPYGLRCAQSFAFSSLTLTI